MEEVFPVTLALGVMGGGSSLNSAEARSSRSLPGRVERRLDSGRYIVILSSGERVEVSGSLDLKVGDAVRVVVRRIQKAVSRTRISRAAEAEALQAKGVNALVTAFLPLAFGGEKAHARLEVYVQGRGKGSLRIKSHVVTFIFDVFTRLQGRIQWGVHLKAREVALQVYAEITGKDVLRSLVSEVEGSLQKRGFSLSAPTVYLKRPFTVPAGFMNVQG